MANTIIYVDYFNLRRKILRCRAAKGVLPSPKEAVRQYKKLAKRGNAFAEFKLGKCYENGDGVRKNCKTAVDCYRSAKDMEIMYRAKNPDTAYLESEQRIREAFIIMEEERTLLHNMNKKDLNCIMMSQNPQMPRINTN